MLLIDLNAKQHSEACILHSAFLHCFSYPHFHVEVVNSTVPFKNSKHCKLQG